MSVPDASRAFIVFLVLAPVLYALAIIPLWVRAAEILASLLPWAWSSPEMASYWQSPWSWSLGPFVRLGFGLHLGTLLLTGAMRHPSLPSTAMRLPVLVGVTTGLVVLAAGVSLLTGVLVSTIWSAANGHLAAEIMRPRRKEYVPRTRYYWVPGSMIPGSTADTSTVVSVNPGVNLFDCGKRENLCIFLGILPPRLNEEVLSTLLRAA